MNFESGMGKVVEIGKQIESFWARSLGISSEQPAWEFKWVSEVDAHAPQLNAATWGVDIIAKTSAEII